MVFQGYALFPHMTVAENVAFPLRCAALPRRRRDAEVRARARPGAARPLRRRCPRSSRAASSSAWRWPARWSSTRRCCCWTSRSRALDKKLRAELQEELKALHRRVGRTFVNVTHDQEEALSLSDQVAILNHGRLVQIGRAAQRSTSGPRTRFVADFLGKTNFLHGTVREVRPRRHGAAGRRDAAGAGGGGHPAPGTPALLSLRPEKIGLLAEAETAENEVAGTIASWAYLGAGYSLAVRTADLGEIRVALPAWRAPIAPREGLPVRLGWAADAAVPVLEDADAA